MTSGSGKKPPRRVATGAQRQRNTESHRLAKLSQERTGKQPTGKQPTTGVTSRRLAAGGVPPTSSRRTTTASKPPRPRWQRWLIKTLAWGTASMFALGTIAVAGLAIAYQRLEVLTPDDFAQAQVSTFYYADGERVMGRLGIQNRESVAIADLPEYVGEAFISAEDRSFLTNPGIDIGGTARAMFKTVVLGKKQGGSTITQQYVERYYVGKTTTDIPGKIKEALQALKIDQQEDKSQILENYMNTVYFGRGAYGVQAAAREYYGKDAADMTVSEAAMLAGILPAPSAWDPRVNPTQAEARWNYVLDGMVSGGWLKATDRLRLEFPEVIPYKSDNVFRGSQGYLLRTAMSEVTAKTGLSEEKIETGGYHVITTIDRAAMSATRAAVRHMPDGASPNLRTAAVVLDVNTGAIISMFGGMDYLKVQQNAVTQDIAQAGSTFKPFALITALESGIALESEYSGDSGIAVEGFRKPVTNFRGVSYGQINLIDATAFSVNTVYAQLAHDVGPKNVMDTAIRLGLPEDTAGLEPNPANVLGTASPHPIDMARAYATIASGGLKIEPHIVAKVLGPDGELVYEAPNKQERVLRSDVAAEAAYAMRQVVNRGSGVYASKLDRQIAGKTGTSNDDKSAWFIGYTPQVVGAVALYQVGTDGSAESIKPFGGFSEITGGSVPVRIWTDMMEEILSDYPAVKFPARTFIGETIKPPEPSPEPSPSPSPEPSPEPSPVPTIPTSPGPTSGGLLPPGGGILPSPGGGGGLLGGQARSR